MKSLSLTIFGITSNLAQIKLIPALYDMAEKGLLPENIEILGNARTPMSKDEFAHYIENVLHSPNIHHTHPVKPEIVKKLLSKFHYISGHLDDPSFYAGLAKILRLNRSADKIFYLATYPELYHHIFENLQKVGLNKQTKGFVRMMIEKPVGNDLKSAKELNQLLLTYFEENQIYRLDHYLGKETLQNILTFRFSNGIFEPLINKDYINHIQITAAEDFGIGARGGYYDQVGALKDVGQNHQLQMLAFATMDAPSEFSSRAVTAQRIKILQDLIPFPTKAVFGQYEGYHQEKNVDPNSNTDTFYALKTYIQNDRFKDVPIYIRAGKKLAQTVTEISIIFKNPANRLLKHLDCSDEPNVLIYRIQPNEGIVLKILTKIPWHENKLQPEYMQYCYRVDPHSHYIPDPYERLIADTIRGDQTFFNDAKEVEAQWAFTDPLASTRKKPYIYKPGSWGPKEADELIEKDGRAWLEPSMDFCRI
ncbi:glucose-6-phosphate dehydrogenase [Candidatus Daviesbacteria bacterium RIFCSPHIGHO2_02_FULL_39_12]|uniref:Glucose-6-phosphate 1-dehydrogenase n=2 Tax=Candidatus Daviesiibacteriota TaxID=1752718 RepID=A0A1F5JD84_9BACT|nr:MAG: glucose-6-phosphate dehydrogenase [Candidatus Daviesbacteria bacterium RIFCSPHIGHO2_02_FULL_39_12]OGE71591.1 MAG: glucose-6-phosphate dehydrogenase [Candidatus Daviesbacteria bacterium RIFCSPLOWO2_02_FULL_38_15]